MATPVSQMTPIPNKDAFRSGMRAGIPVAVGYIPIAIAFGLLAKSFDMPNVITLAMSLFIFAGASQFIGVQLIMAGSMYWEIILTTFILNLRHFLMSASLSQRLETTSNRFLAAIAFGVTDETFSVASTRDESTRGHFVLGLNLIAFLAWNVGTWIGVFLAFGLPASVQASMGIALYAMFIGLLVPSLTRKPVIVVAAIAVLTQAILYFGISLFLLVLAMAFVTYIPRLVPLLWLRDIKLPPFLKRFLLFTPYAVLASLIFPGILQATTSLTSALAGGVVAATLAFLRVNLMLVVIGGIVGVYLIETFL